MASTSARANPLQAQWSKLPLVLLEIISTKSADIADYIRFGAVCSSWRAATKPAKPLSHHRQLPWLLLPYYPKDTTRSFYFYSLSQNKLYTFDLPDARVKSVVSGSPYGWLAMVDWETMALSLLNPITKAEIHLPPTTGFSWARDRKIYQLTVILSSNPSGSNDDCVVIVTHALKNYYARELTFCRVGDEKWTVADSTLPFPLASVLYHKRRFYAVDYSGNGVVLDGHSLARLSSIRAPMFIDYEINFLRNFATIEFFLISRRQPEELLLIVMYYRVVTQLGDSGILMNIFKLKDQRWSGPVTSIGDSTVFLTPYWSKSAIWVSIPQQSKCKEDCVYINLPTTKYFSQKEDYIMLRLDIKRGRYVPTLSVATDKLKIHKDQYRGEWLTPSLC